MALKVELKPNERIIVGESVITNCDHKSWLVIEGSSPILREKDILTASRADTPAKRIYLAVQLMYTSRDPLAHHEVYFALVPQIVQAAPSTWNYIELISNQISARILYKALKEAKKLAKAPLKKKVELWVGSFELPDFNGNDNEVVDDIKAKFMAFKSWAIKQADNV